MCSSEQRETEKVVAGRKKRFLHHREAKKVINPKRYFPFVGTFRHVRNQLLLGKWCLVVL